MLSSDEHEYSSIVNVMRSQNESIENVMRSHDETTVQGPNLNTSRKLERNAPSFNRSISIGIKKKSGTSDNHDRRTSLNLNDMPEEFAAKLRHLDLANDGFIDIEDILVLDQKEQVEEQTIIDYRRMFIILVIVWIVQIAAVFAVSFAAIKSTKDSYVTNNQLTTVSGSPVQTANVDSCILRNGVFSKRNLDGSCAAVNSAITPAISTSRSTAEVELSSTLSDISLKQILSIYAVSPTGTTVFLTLNGFFHHNAGHLTMLTNIGTLELHGSKLSYTDTTQEEYFLKAGFPIDSATDTRKGSRRLDATSLTAVVNNAGEVFTSPTFFEPTITPTTISSENPISNPSISSSSSPSIDLRPKPSPNPIQETIIPTLLPTASPTLACRSSPFSFTTPPNAVSIPLGAYQNCSTITSVEIHSDVTSIGDVAFAYTTNLESVNLMVGLKVISKGMFRSSALNKVTVTSTVTYIGDNAFASCLQLKVVNLEDGLTVLGREMFRSSGLLVVTVPSSLTSIGNGVFSSCTGLYFVFLIMGFKNIGSYMFEHSTSLVNLDFPDTLESIGDHAFGASGLSTISIPKTVTLIGEYAFADIASLSCVYWMGSEISSPPTIFSNSPTKSC